jgi:hypothetical protein
VAEIELTRPTGYRVDRGRKYQVFIDRKKLGNIKLGETKVFTLPPGRHELQLKIDWGVSERLQVDLGDSDRAAFVCAPRVKQNDVTIVVGYRLAFWMTLGCRRYIDLRPGDELAAVDEARSGLRNLDGPKLFGIALLIGVIIWALTGQSIVVLGVVVAAMSIVVAGFAARGIGKATVQVGEEVQKRRDG